MSLLRSAIRICVLWVLSFCALAEEQVPGAITQHPWQEVVISVTDLDRTAEFFTGIGGYEEKWRGALTTAEIAFWGLGREATAEALLLGPSEAEFGLVRLVRFDGVGRREATRPGARAWDTGCYYSLNVHTRGIQSVYDDAIRIGWWTETPITSTGTDESTRSAVVFRGPDGVQVQGLEQPEAVAEGDRLSGPFSVLQTVRDRDAAHDFFANVLGFKTLRHGDRSATAEPGYKPFGIPRTTTASAGVSSSELFSRSQETGLVEIAEIAEFKGHDHAARCVAPNLGILALRYAVASTKDALYDIAGRGGRIELFASGVRIEPYGDVRLFNAKTPDGANVHFFERLDPVDNGVEGGAGTHSP